MRKCFGAVCARGVCVWEVNTIARLGCHQYDNSLLLVTREPHGDGPRRCCRFGLNSGPLPTAWWVVVAGHDAPLRGVVAADDASDTDSDRASRRISGAKGPAAAERGCHSGAVLHSPSPPRRARCDAGRASALRCDPGRASALRQRGTVAATLNDRSASASDSDEDRSSAPHRVAAAAPRADFTKSTCLCTAFTRSSCHDDVSLPL